MSAVTRSWTRFLVLAVLLAATFGLLRARDREEILPTHETLSKFPAAARAVAREGPASQSGDPGGAGSG